MSKQHWLDNNDYLEQQGRSEYRRASWLCWGIALVLLLVPVRQSFTRIYYIHAAQDTPTLTGTILKLERDTGTRQERKYHAKVEMTYRGRTYLITEAGFCFTQNMYEQALESGTVPVYLNPEQPEKSVLSKGITLRNYIAPGLFLCGSLLLFGVGVYTWRRSR